MPPRIKLYNPSMKATTKQDLKIAALAWLTIAAMFGFMGIMYWAGIDWEKWFGFTLFTGCVFGVMLYKYDASFKKARCALLFVALLAVHVTVWSYYLRPVSGFPMRLFFVAPFEGAVVAFFLVMVGGARSTREGAPGKRHHKGDQNVKLP
jgi:hypothetical protein